MNDKNLSRRSILRGAAATAVALPFGVTLASCAITGGGSDDDDNDDSDDGDDGPVDEDNPFGIEEDTDVEAVIFDGGYGIDYVETAGDVLADNHSGVTAMVSGTNDVAQELQPRFVSGDVPDLLDNSGEGSIGWNQILDQLEELDDVLEAPNLEGETIADTLFDGVKGPGTFGGRFVTLNYVMTLYAVWYSSSLFDEHGWEVPQTWDDAKELGAKAKEEGLYLFTFGKEAATYYQTLAMDSAIREGGDEVRLGLENLEEDCWSHPAMQEVFQHLKDCVDEGYFVPGGSGTQFTAAQAQWSNDQEALLYPSGSWIENEMKSDTADGFEMKGFAGLSISDDPALGHDALRAEAGEPFCVPSDADNVAGGKELLRTMLSKEAASKFAEEKLAPTVVRDTVPDDGFGSTALVSQTEMLEAAGENGFTYKFVDLYGLDGDQLTVWNSFLDGNKSVDELTEELQKITDDARDQAGDDLNEVTE